MAKAFPGRYWQIDADGFIVNDASRDLIQPEFLALIQACIEYCVAHIEADLDSIYVTGSVARGVARPGISDINIIPLLAYHVDAELVMQDWIDTSSREIQEKFLPLISDVEFDLFPQGFVFRNSEEFSVGAFILKTHSVCVWGSDIASELPEFNIHDENIRLAIANDDILHFEDDLSEAKAILTMEEDPEEIRHACRIICRQIIHAGYGLVMEKSRQHTRDLILSAELFAKHYPQYAHQIEQIQEYALSPIDDREAILSHLDTFGAVIQEACEEWLNTHNPQRDEFFLIGEADDLNDETARR